MTTRATAKAEPAAMIETAAERYARLKAQTFEKFLEDSFSDEALKDVALFDVVMPDGVTTFKCRKLDLAYSKQAGAMPATLAAHTSLGEDGDPEAMFARMTPAERRAGMKTSFQMLQYVCVEPRLMVIVGPEDTNAIALDDLTSEDFGFLIHWAQTGGDAANEGLATFRPKR